MKQLSPYVTATKTTLQGPRAELVKPTHPQTRTPRLLSPRAATTEAHHPPRARAPKQKPPPRETCALQLEKSPAPPKKMPGTEQTLKLPFTTSPANEN